MLLKDSSFRHARKEHNQSKHNLHLIVTKLFTIIFNIELFNLSLSSPIPLHTNICICTKLSSIIPFDISISDLYIFTGIFSLLHFFCNAKQIFNYILLKSRFYCWIMWLTKIHISTLNPFCPTFNEINFDTISLSLTLSLSFSVSLYISHENLLDYLFACHPV